MQGCLEEENFFQAISLEDIRLAIKQVKKSQGNVRGKQIFGFKL